MDPESVASRAPEVRFEPLRPASRGRVIAAFVLGPIMWLVGLVIGAALVDRGGAIVFGAAVTIMAFVVSVAVLAVSYKLRRRQERRYARRR